MVLGFRCKDLSALLWGVMLQRRPSPKYVQLLLARAPRIISYPHLLC